MDCLFCKIIVGEIPNEKVYEDEEMFAFKDISPQAPMHFLLIPKEHVKSVNDLRQEDTKLIGHISLKAVKTARGLGCKSEHRIVNSCRENGGQGIDHLHFHVSGQRSLQWPPG